MKESTFIKPPCKLVGTNGNAFAIIANVSRTLKRAGLHDQTKEWEEKAIKQESYDDLLILVYSYVDAE